jgi:glucose-1-phosphate cytidylyltransferase
VLKAYDSQIDDDNWDITVSDTGLETMTAGRLLKVEKFVKEDANEDEPFIVTYGDSLSNLDINEVIEFHKSTGKIGTVCVAHPTSRFGVLDIEDTTSLVTDFKEKPILSELVNIGFFIFDNRIFDILREIENVDNYMFESEPIRRLIEKRELAAYKFDGFYQPVDTKREISEMNSLWDNNKAKWKVWN